jgi:hypothetical protein
MFTLSKANYDWVLHLDNDELLGKKLKNGIRDLIEKAEKKGFVAFSTVRVNYDVKCKHILFGPAYPDRQVRIYKKNRVLYRELVHEYLRAYGKIYELLEEYFIIHYGSQSKHRLVFYAYLESRVL